MISQKDQCLKILNEYIEKLEKNANESESFNDYGTVEIGMTSLLMLRNVLRSQEIKEPLDDVVIFAGYPEMDSPCYHILVRPEDRERMEKDPNIHFCHMKKFTGVMEQDNKPRKKLVERDGQTFCAECGRRIYAKYRPSHCRDCGTVIDWSGEWWYRDE